ncbi:hypothetical protein FJZ26_02745 [Candidatus Parvarchaeota archaeon]|nr:hypothetical protein [Candidatus Parvarchaeota archaeon]
MSLLTFQLGVFNYQSEAEKSVGTRVAEFMPVTGTWITGRDAYLAFKDGSTAKGFALSALTVASAALDVVTGVAIVGSFGTATAPAAAAQGSLMRGIKALCGFGKIWGKEAAAKTAQRMTEQTAVQIGETTTKKGLGEATKLLEKTVEQTERHIAKTNKIINLNSIPKLNTGKLNPKNILFSGKRAKATGEVKEAQVLLELANQDIKLAKSVTSVPKKQKLLKEATASLRTAQQSTASAAKKLIRSGRFHTAMYYGLKGQFKGYVFGENQEQSQLSDKKQQQLDAAQQNANQQQRSDLNQPPPGMAQPGAGQTSVDTSQSKKIIDLF